MKRLLLILVLTLLPSLAQAQAISAGQTTLAGFGAIFGDGTEVFTFAGNPAANSLVCAFTGLGSGTNMNSVTGLGATWSTPSTTTHTTGDVSVSCACDPNGSSAAVTVNTDAEASGNIRYMLVNFTQSGGAGFDCANLRTTATVYTAHASPHPSGSVTPGTADNVCMGFSKGSSGVYTAEAGWTSVTLGDNARGIGGTLIQTSATGQSFDPTTDASEDVATLIMCVDSPASGGGASVPPPIGNGAPTTVIGQWIPGLEVDVEARVAQFKQGRK